MKGKIFTEYLTEFVYGGIDGSITTFAVVAGASGAGLDSSIIIILGFANLIADGFSMSVGAFLSSKSEKESYMKHQRREYWEVEHLPHLERQEITEIYAAKGFKGELLDQIVDKITSNKDVWVDVMMKEELELTRQSKSPWMIGLATFISFFIVGIVPLIIYVSDYFHWLAVSGKLFLISSLLTGTCFLIIGYLKSVINQTHRLKSMMETLFLGAAAAVLAYYTGFLLEKLIS